MLKNTVFESVSRDKKDCWDKTGLLGAWLQSNQLLAVTRAAELFPNLDPTRRGHDDNPREDPEPDTDVGAPVDVWAYTLLFEPRFSLRKRHAAPHLRGSGREQDAEQEHPTRAPFVV